MIRELLILLLAVADLGLLLAVAAYSAKGKNVQGSGTGRRAFHIDHRSQR